jgi:cell division protein FtsN
MINKPVIIVQEDGYYKVRVTGFTSREELQKMVPVLQKLGMKDIWIPAVKEQPIIVQPVIPKPDTLERKPEKIYPDTAKAVRPVVVHPAQAVADTTEARKEQVKEEPPAEVKPSAPKPTISLHVGEFRKRSQALRAQRKVASKFDVTVDLYMRWDSYHLVIRGFYNREDTFRYYPELAGMGYTNIYVIQEK